MNPPGGGLVVARLSAPWSAPTGDTQCAQDQSPSADKDVHTDFKSWGRL